MADSPHTPELRAKVSQEYLDGSSCLFLTEKDNIEYSSDFKKICVDAVLSGKWRSIWQEQEEKFPTLHFRYLSCLLCKGHICRHKI